MHSIKHINHLVIHKNFEKIEKVRYKNDNIVNNFQLLFLDKCFDMLQNQFTRSIQLKVFSSLMGQVNLTRDPDRVYQVIGNRILGSLNLNSLRISIDSCAQLIYFSQIFLADICGIQFSIIWINVEKISFSNFEDIFYHQGRRVCQHIQQSSAYHEDLQLYQ